MTRVAGEEAAAVGLHACGVVRVMLRFRCVDRPHIGPVLTLPEPFNRLCKVLSGRIIQLCPSEGEAPRANITAAPDSLDRALLLWK